ncbi:cytochrome P450 [Amycolatopsis sp. cg5]|uniref:cytochrome P450 n=1 Tax=Amycolatopsis sp. cg5 TaxID=3238802 RepID=UPI00352423DD
MSRSKRGGLPPGPRLPAVVQTVLWAVAPVRFGKACLARYGPLFTMRIVGFGDTVYVCTPELIHKILRDEDGMFDAAVANKSIKFVVGEHSLLLSGGATHAERRRLLMQPLHGSNVGEYVDLMETIVEQEIRAWQPGSTVRLLEVFQRVTLEVMIRAVFGISDSTRLHRLRELVPKLLDINPAIIVLPWLRRSFGGFGPWAKLQSVLRAVDEIILAEIADRRAAPTEGRDLLSILLRDEKFELSARELRDHLVTLLAVGQETTATQLAWFFERVLRAPREFERIEAEVAEGNWAFLEAAIHEAVRIRPTTMDIGRVGTARWESGGHVFPAGTMFAVSLGLLHLSPDLHANPDRYSVGRFFPAEPPAAHFRPFGGGAHRCLGASLAMVEMRTIISAILRHVRLNPSTVDAERVTPKGPMLLPGRGAEVVVVENALAEK